MPDKDQWIAAISRRYGPRYIAIVEALAEMIESGLLRGGQQIPTQRELASMLGLTPGTTARAYAIAAQRGLISGETGRGTFVRRGAAVPTLPRDVEYREAGPDRRQPPSNIVDGSSLGDMAVPNVGADNLQDELSAAITKAAGNLDFNLGRYYPYTAQIPLRFRQVGVQWLARLGLTVDPADVILTNGANGALYVILFSENLRRLPVMTPVLTYAGLRNIAIAHKHPLIPIAVDESGPTPQSIELACKQSNGRVLYLQSNVHNPTCVAMPLERRQAIVEIARRYDLIVIEDNAAPLSLSSEIAPIAALAPERTFLISSCAKSISPTVNAGIVSVPRGWASQLNVAIKTHHIYAPMFNIEVLRILLEDRILDRIFERSRTLVASRAAIARSILAPFRLRTHPDSWFAWLELPGSWTSEAFTTAARMQGVAVGGSQNFTIEGALPDQNGLRLSLTSPATEEALADYTRKIRQLLQIDDNQLRSIV